MGQARRQLRGRWRLIFVWGVLLLVVIAHRLYSYCTGAGGDTCELVLEQGVAVGSTIVVAFFAFFSFRIWSLRKQNASEAALNSVPGFRNQPEKYHEQMIALYGRIESVLPDTAAEQIKRKVTDAYRTAIKDDDNQGRYIHQRFLISSPQLRNGECLMVHNNVKFGKKKLRKKVWVKVCGEYVHKRVPRGRGGAGLTYYGLIHHTHEPVGYLTVLDSEPTIPSDQVVERVTPSA